MLFKRKLVRKNQKEDINKYGEGDILPDLHNITLFCLLCIAEIWSKQNCIPKEKKTAQIIRKTCSNYMIPNRFHSALSIY